MTEKGRIRGAAPSDAGRAMTVRNVVLAQLGATVLVLVPAYDGPFREVVGSYAGNVAVSFALYFAARNATDRYRRPRLLAAAATLLAVELFEATDGFGIMANVFDPVDFVVNAAGLYAGAVAAMASVRLAVKLSP